MYIYNKLSMLYTFFKFGWLIELPLSWSKKKELLESIVGKSSKPIPLFTRIKGTQTYSFLTAPPSLNYMFFLI